MRRVRKVRAVSCSLCRVIPAERAGSRMVFQPRSSLVGRLRADAAPKEKPSVLCRGVGLQVASRFRRTNKRVMRNVAGVVPDAMQNGEEVKEGRERGSRKEFARRTLLEYHPHYTRRCSLLVRAGGSLRSFRNASSRRESAQVFRVRDVRDCAMGPDASSILISI